MAPRPSWQRHGGTPLWRPLLQPCVPWTEVPASRSHDRRELAVRRAARRSGPRREVIAALVTFAMVSCSGQPPDPGSIGSAQVPQPPGAAAAADRIASEVAAARDGVADFAQYFAEDVAIADAWGCGPVVGRDALIHQLAASRGSTFEELEVEAVYLDPVGAAVVERVAGLDDDLLEIRRYGPDGIVASRLLHPLDPATPSVRRARRRAIAGPNPDPPLAAWGDQDGTIALLVDEPVAACPGVAIVLVEPTPEPGVSTRRFRTVEDLHRCGPGAAAGWWDELDEPPPSDAITGHVWIGTMRVAVRGASAPIDGLLRWASSRFALGGLSPPSLSSVTVASATGRCDGVGGRVEQAGPDRHASLLLCFDRARCPRSWTGCRDVCTDASCEHHRRAARMTVLHELAHSWEASQLDATDREHYLEQTGLTSWLGADVPWHERGGERAAVVIAWGLLDHEVTLARFGSPSCEQLRSEYQLLTGQDPIWGACSSSEVE